MQHASDHGSRAKMRQMTSVELGYGADDVSMEQGGVKVADSSVRGDDGSVSSSAGTPAKPNPSRYAFPFPSPSVGASSFSHKIKGRFSDVIDQLPSGTKTRRSEYALGVYIALTLLACVCCAACGIMATMGLCCKKCKKRFVRKQFKFKGRVIFEWEQDDASVTIYIHTPRSVKKDEIEVRIWPRHLIVRKKGAPPFMKDELYGAVNDKASLWTFPNSDELQIRLSKAEPVQWPCVLQSHAATKL